MPKRRFQKGCIRKVGESWVLYFYRDENRDGIIRRVQASQRLGSTRDLSSRAARATAQPILDAVNSQTEISVKSKGVTLAEFIPEWRQTVVPTLKPSTVKGAESSLRAHILPVLGDVPLTKLDAKQVQNLVSSLEGCSRKTRENIVMDLFAIMSAARGEQWQHKVPVTELSQLYIPGAGPSEPYSFSPEEMSSILTAFKGKRPWDLFFTMLALTGLRASEILDLRVRDCDLKRSLIFVRQTAWEGQIIQGTKTEDSRTASRCRRRLRRNSRHTCSPTPTNCSSSIVVEDHIHVTRSSRKCFTRCLTSWALTRRAVALAFMLFVTAWQACLLILRGRQ